MTTIFFAIFLLLMAYHWWWSRSPKVQLINEIPGIGPNLPILGNSIEILLNVYGLKAWYDRKLQHLGGIFRVWILGQPNVLVTNAKYSNAILRSTKYTRKGELYSFFSDWIHLGYRFGVPFTREQHKRKRKCWGPLLQLSSVLQELTHIFNKCALTMCDRLKKYEDKNVEVFTMTKCCAFDIIYESTLGVPGSAQSDEGCFYQTACDDLLDASLRRYITPWLKPTVLWNISSLKRKYDKILKQVSDICDEIISDRKKEFLKAQNEQGYSPKCILDNFLLLEDEIENTDLRYSMNGLIFAGSDTTGTTMGWFLGLMGSHPAVQEKVVEEMEEIFGNSGRLPEIQDLENMKYLEMCIKETMRLFPAAPMIGRILPEEMIVDQYKLPADTVIILLIINIHRNPDHYSNPDEFEPERFSAENSKERLPGTFLPFSVGDQNCLGQRFAMLEMKSVLSTILRRYKVECTFDLHNVEFLPHLVLKPAEPLTIKVTERQSGLRVVQ